MSASNNEDDDNISFLPTTNAHPGGLSHLLPPSGEDSWPSPDLSISDHQDVDNNAPDFPHYPFLEHSHDYMDDDDDCDDDSSLVFGDFSLVFGDFSGPVSQDPVDTTETGFKSVGLSFPIDQANIMYTRLIQLIYDIAVHH
jgi:hypothetical protein